MKRVRQKLKRKWGFTLAETLITILILLMVSSIMAAGIPAAASAFTKAVDAANAQALLSTTVNALRRELSTARLVDITDGSTIVYYSSKTGSQSTISKGNGGTIMLQEYSDQENKPLAHPLVSEAASLKKDKLSVTYSTASYDETTRVITISGIAVSKENSENAIASMPVSGLQIHVAKEAP